MIIVEASKRNKSIELFLNSKLKDFLKVYVTNIADMYAEKVNHKLLIPNEVEEDCRNIICDYINYGKFRYVDSQYILELNNTLMYNDTISYKKLYNIIDKGNLSCRGLNFELLLNKYIEDNVIRLYKIYKGRSK